MNIYLCTTSSNYHNSHRVLFSYLIHCTTKCAPKIVV